MEEPWKKKIEKKVSKRDQTLSLSRSQTAVVNLENREFKSRSKSVMYISKLFLFISFLRIKHHQFVIANNFTIEK